MPNYAILHINSNMKAARNTKKHTGIYCIKQEIKSLYVKKANLNRFLFKLHLLVHNMIHPAIIDNTMNKVNAYIADTMRMICQKQNLKLERLIAAQHTYHFAECKHSFFPSMFNLTDITFAKDEMNLLNKGYSF